MVSTIMESTNHLASIVSSGHYLLYLWLAADILSSSAPARPAPQDCSIPNSSGSAALPHKSLARLPFL